MYAAPWKECLNRYAVPWKEYPRGSQWKSPNLSTPHPVWPKGHICRYSRFYWAVKWFLIINRLTCVNYLFVKSKCDTYIKKCVFFSTLCDVRSMNVYVSGIEVLRFQIRSFIKIWRIQICTIATKLKIRKKIKKLPPCQIKSGFSLDNKTKIEL